MLERNLLLMMIVQIETSSSTAGDGGLLANETRTYKSLDDVQQMIESRNQTQKRKDKSLLFEAFEEVKEICSLLFILADIESAVK